MIEPLILDPAPELLWHELQAASQAPAATDPVLSRWWRSRELGAPPAGPRPEDALERAASLRARTERIEPLLACGRGILERVSAAAEQHDHALLVSDADGVIVHAAAGGAFADTARRVRLLEGAHWDEATRGTNAIGTALAEGRPVFVRGNAHYARAYQDLVCYAAPVRDPDGALVAVLDATSAFARDDASMGFGVVAAAHALEEVLRVRAYALAGAAVTRAIARSLDRMSCPVALVEPPGRVARWNDSARRLFGGAVAGGRLRDLVGLDYEALVRHAVLAGAVSVHAPALGRALRLRLEPIESDGRRIAVLTFFEPDERASARPVAEGSSGAEDVFPGLFAHDERTREALAWAARVAPSDLPVMLLAETGCGKELVARGIHTQGRRAAGPFVAVNCGSIQATLLESELFGYGPGAFTGAERGGRHGYLAAAAGGTLFLDEVAEMPLAMQAALLRFLETGTYRRVGETELRTADVRVVCATCRELPAMVERGEFRRDLFFRLKGATVLLPPLRARTDVVALARHLLGTLAGDRAPGLSREVETVLAGQPWPGNVRELKSTLEVALVLSADAPRVEVQHLPPELRAGAPAAGSGPAFPAPRSGAALAHAEGEAVRRALREAGGNVSAAARLLGVARSTLYRMMRRHGCEG